jgi:lipoprotein-anchoring transpeptidase ErfK/SrfK
MATAIVLIAMVVILTVYSALSVQAAGRTSAEYQNKLRHLDASIQQAHTQGYTDQDLKPVLGRLHQVQTRKEPAWFGSRPGFWNQQVAEVGRLEGALPGQMATAVSSSRIAVAAALDAARAAIDKDRQAGVDDASVSGLTDRLGALTASYQGARTIREFHQLDGQVRQLGSDVAAIGKAQAQENQLLDQAAQQLIQQKGGDINALRQIGQDALGAGRNEATVASYMNFGHQFKGDYQQVNVAYQRLEKYGPMLSSADATQVARAAAAGQRYSAQVHDAYMKGAPSKFIAISLDAQQLWAYENGGEVQTSLVTTGQPALPTDTGPMRVLRKNSPWKMVSPWPKESPFYYESAWVQMAIWFTSTGEALHDANWEPDSYYGPGSQYTGSASHGCVHVLPGPEKFLFNWVDSGTPVVVYPGDAAPVASQVQRMTTDDQGVPPNGAGFRGA